MQPKDPTQSKQKSDYSSLFVSTVLLLLVGLALEGIETTPVQRFFEGLLIGMSIACSVIGFVVYARASKEK